MSSTKFDSKIYRVTNDADYTSLCGAGRFGYDYENLNVVKDEIVFEKAVEAFKKAKNVLFTSVITNEEIKLLQLLKDKLGFNLVNDEAKKFQNFMKSFASTANESLYNATLEDVAQSDFIVSIGASISSDNPMLRFNISKAVNKNRAYVASLHPIKDDSISNLLTQHIKNEVGSEEAALAMIADAFVTDKSSQKEFFDSLDLGYLSGESNISDEEIELLVHYSKRKKKPLLVIGEDLINHNRSENIAKIAGMLQKNGIFKVLVMPPVTNSLGVTLIANLDERVDGYSVGYNCQADFVLSAKGEGDLDMPALNQQEGTFVNIDKNLVVLNAGLSYGGYELNDIVNALGIKNTETINQTSQLGFKTVAFDDLVESVDNAGVITRGYKIESQTNNQNVKIDEVEELGEYNGSVVYSANPINQFNKFTKDCAQIIEKLDLIGSEQFAIASKIKSGDRVKFVVNGVEYTRNFKVDRKMTGTIAYNPDFDANTKSAEYRYNQVKIEVANG
jgi:NADH-quinone oxidoreductase subunit G